ncbi:MAG: hypothetical protein ACE37F_21270 [Nannocystaceae bacterium]
MLSSAPTPTAEEPDADAPPPPRGGECKVELDDGFVTMSAGCDLEDLARLEIKAGADNDAAAATNRDGAAAPTEPKPCDATGNRICVVAGHDAGLTVTLPPSLHDHIVDPDTPFRFTVQHSACVAPPKIVGEAGTIGLSEPVFDGQSVNREKETPEQEQGEKPCESQEFKSFPWSAAPRQPGEVKFKIMSERKEKDASKNRSDEKVLEFIVERRYAGAFRIGLGFVFPWSDGHRDREYASITRPNSSQAEIVATREGPMNYEFVVGFAPYVFDYIGGRGGRSYASEHLADRASRGIAPYIGLGVVQVGDHGIDAFSSAHLGFEWEPQRNFSIAVTAMARRVKRLGGGLRVGEPAPGSLPTRTTFRFGLGLIINFSPKFFQFATSSGVFKS